MSRFLMMRSLMKQRLTAAVEVMSKQFERTITGYEKEIRRVKEEKERQQKLLEVVSNPEVQLHTADVQQLMVQREKVPSEQQDRRPSLDEGSPAEPAHTKEGQEEVWINQGREQLQEPEEDDISMLMFTPVPVKRGEGDEGKGENCGGSEQDRDLNPHSHLQAVSPDKPSDLSGSDTDDSADWEEGDEPQEGSNPLKRNSVGTSVHSSKCASSSGQKKQQKHQRIEKQANPLTCSVCCKMLESKLMLFHHMLGHQRRKPFSCSVCGRSFHTQKHLRRHMGHHADKKPFRCSVCKKSFSSKSEIQSHMGVHTGEKPFSCSLCDKRFSRLKDLRIHKVTHAEKTFRCLVCDKRFFYKHALKRHSTVHKVKEPFSSAVCNKEFTERGRLKNHICVGTSRKNSKKPEDTQQISH